MSGLKEIARVRVVNVASDEWERFVPEDQSHAGHIEFEESADGAGAGDDRSKVQWLRERAPSTGGVHMASGLYWMEPSVFDFVFPGDETIHLVHGSIDVVIEGAARVELRTGDIAYFPEGLSTTWHVLEPTLEFFTLLG